MVGVLKRVVAGLVPETVDPRSRGEHGTAHTLRGPSWSVGDVALLVLTAAVVVLVTAW